MKKNRNGRSVGLLVSESGHKKTLLVAVSSSRVISLVVPSKGAIHHHNLHFPPLAK